MLLDPNLVRQIIAQYNINVTGVLHVGAHDCEELGFYQSIGLTPNDVVWLDAYKPKVEQAKQRGIPNVHHALVTDVDGETLDFHVANNIQSSSIYNFKKHAILYPEVTYVDTVTQKSITIDTFFKQNQLDPSKYVFWNLDIQGAELLALKGGKDSIKYVKFLYIEANKHEIYENGALFPELNAFLEENGFKGIITNISDSSGWDDVIYVRVRE